MSSDQKRDADMDRLLRAVLKPAPQPSAGACPDPDVLAALVEGNLTASEQSALDAHMVECGRCQEALAILSHDLPREEVEQALVPRQSKWFTWVTQPRLRWLVPISAVATVAVVFFATRPLIAPEGEVPGADVARLAQAPAAPTDMPAAGGGALREQSAPVSEKDQRAAAAGETPARAERARDKTTEPVPETMAARVGSEEKAAQPSAPAPTPPPAVPAETQLAVAPRAANVAVAADAVSKEPAPERERAALLAGAPAMKPRKLEARLLTVFAPGGSVMWRFGAGGRLSRSADAGDTWRDQVSGVSADLLAGAAPSPATCWIVGTAGVVLLTADGEQWERRPFPEAVDLVAVAASNARNATVTTRDGRRFETLDAGLTWFLKPR